MVSPVQGARPVGDRSTPAYRAAVRDLTKGALAAGLVGFSVNVLHLALPLYNVQIFDRVIGGGSIDTLVALTVIVGIVLAFQAVLDFLRSRIFAILAGRVAATLGRPVFEAAVEASLRHGPAAAGGAVRDLSEVRGFVAGGAIALPLDLTFTPVLLGVLFLLHPLYGLVGLVGAAILTAAAIATELLARRPVARATLANGQAQSETAAALRNAEVIAAMGMLPAIARRWRTTQGRSLDSIDRGRSVAKALSAVARMLRTAIQIATICTGAVLVIRGAVSTGTLMAAAVIMSRLLLPFEHLIDGWRQWVDAFAALDRLRDVLDRGAAARSATPIAIGTASFLVDRVSYVPPGGEVPLLRNVSFRIGPGELLGVIGPSGAGKSTLARLAVGLWAPTAGGVFLDGQNAYLHERASFGEAVGYLPQEPLLLEGTVRENIARFREASIEDVVAAARAAGIHDLIGRLPKGYETRISDGGGVLSGGQRQRVALARAIFGNPKLLVLDEPNSSLDADGETALVQAVEAARAQGAAVLVVAQRLSILGRADRLLLLKDGAVAQYGDRAEVLAAMAPQRPARMAAPAPRLVASGGPA